MIFELVNSLYLDLLKEHGWHRGLVRRFSGP